MLVFGGVVFFGFQPFNVYRVWIFVIEYNPENQPVNDCGDPGVVKHHEFLQKKTKKEHERTTTRFFIEQKQKIDRWEHLFTKPISSKRHVTVISIGCLVCDNDIGRNLVHLLAL